MAYHGIRIFQPPQYENEDEETVQENEEIIVCPLYFCHSADLLPHRARSRSQSWVPTSSFTRPTVGRSAVVHTRGV